jgi:hypothetical protein
MLTVTQVLRGNLNIEQGFEEAVKEAFEGDRETIGGGAVRSNNCNTANKPNW